MKRAAHEITFSRTGTGLGHTNVWRTIRRTAIAALEAEGVDVPAQISVMLTDDEGIRALNHQFRGIDSATDVLSFPMNELEPGEFYPEECERDEETGLVVLGDMVISLERAQAQAEEFGHCVEREMAYLSVHSVLHLLGYDHMDEGAQKQQMRAREEAILSALGITRG